MHFDHNSRTFTGKASNIKADKGNKLAVVEIDCGDRGVATFRVAVKLSSHGHPVLSIRTIKPKTGEIKKRELMSLPVPKESNDLSAKTKAKKKSVQAAKKT
jgi:hypothetical protein